MLRRAVLIVSVAVACAGCGWIIPDDRDVPDDVREMFEQEEPLMAGPGADCHVLADQVRLVATAVEPDAVAPMQWYIAPTDDGGYSDWTVRVNDSGDVIGGGGGSSGCGANVQRGDGLWWSGGGGSDAEVVHGGHAPEGSQSVTLTFEGHDPVSADVNSEGYFLLVLAESACCEWSFPDLLEALDADGNVIESTNRPMG